MSEVEVSSEARTDAAERSVEMVFALLWDALADLLGSAATATLVRRAAQRAAWRCPQLGELIIARMDLDYRYTLPSAWKETEGDPLALRELARDLRPLLIDLTGTVVINHLSRTPELRQLGFIPAQERS